MKITNFFLPKQIPEGTTAREREQIPYLINTMLFMAMLFCLLCAIQVLVGAMLEAIMLAMSFIAFMLTLTLIKRNNIKGAIWCAMIGLFFIQFVVIFVMSVGENPYGLYRISSFLYAMSITNFLISTRLSQILVYFFVSLVMWILGIFFAGSQITEEAMPLFVAAASAGGIGFIFANVVLLFLFKMFEKLNRNITTEKERVQGALSKITGVLAESRQGLEVGNVLSEETTTASLDVTKMNETFLMLKGDADQLTHTTDTMLKATNVIEHRSKGMRTSTQGQNVAITESSVALTEISANLSNINAIASQRRKKMNDLLGLLKGQRILVQQTLLEVKRVKESSSSIGDFVHTVEDIANQTGLLAMNASIEAAHAGSAGKGFAVIAQEIRKLSEETAKNAAHIGDALKTNEQTVEIASNAVITFAAQTEQSTEELQTTISAIEEILMGISEMDLGTREVLNSMQHIVEKSRQNGDLVDEVSEKISEQGSAMTEISVFAKKLQTEIEGTNKQLENIRKALENIAKAAAQNVVMSRSVNTALGQIEM